MKKSNNKHGWLCSGYRVFPDGTKCKGCIDCNFGKSKDSIYEVFKRTNTLLKIIKKKNK